MFAAAVHTEEPTALPDGIRGLEAALSRAPRGTGNRPAADERIAIGVAEITPARIDDPETDMNSLAVAAHAEAIEGTVGDLERAGDVNGPISGLCDACDTDADRFARRVTDACSLEGLAVDARHGADDDSPLVGAASIIAKVERDARTSPPYPTSTGRSAAAIRAIRPPANFSPLTSTSTANSRRSRARVVVDLRRRARGRRTDRARAVHSGMTSANLVNQYVGLRSPTSESLPKTVSCRSRRTSRSVPNQ